MIASAKKVPAWYNQFLAMLPAIQRYAKFAFRRLDTKARDEAIQEVVANSMVAFVRLFELGKVDLAYPIVLARYAIARFATAGGSARGKKRQRRHEPCRPAEAWLRRRAARSF